MIIVDTLLFGMVATLLGLKVALLAAAAVLFVRGLAERMRQRKTASAPAATKHQGLDEYA